MGITITKLKNGKFKLTHSVTDHTTKPMTRYETLQYLHSRWEMDFKLKFIEEFMAFPCHWYDRKTEKVIMDNREGKDDYFKWLTSLSDEEYCEAVDKKYEECMQEIEEN